MTDQPITEKPILSIKEFFYILSLFIGFGIQYMAFKVQLHDAVSEINYNKKEYVFQMADVLKRLDTHDHHFLQIDGILSPAMKPKEIKIEPQ